MQIKKKLERSVVGFEGTEKLHRLGAAHEAFQNVFRDSQLVNKPFEKSVAENIKGSHWSTGQGRFGGSSMYKADHIALSLRAAKNAISSERIAQLKASNFNL